MNNKWISVKEKLPKDDEWVLCQLDDEWYEENSMMVLYHTESWGREIWVDGQMGTEDYDVVAWMPLPKPYVEEEAEKKFEEDIEERKKLINQGKKAKFMNAFHGETWYDCPFCGESFEYYDAWYSRGFEKTEFKDIYKHKCGNYIYFE